MRISWFHPPLRPESHPGRVGWTGTGCQRGRRQTTTDWPTPVWRTGSLLGVAACTVGQRLAERLAGGLELGDELLVAGAQRGEPVLELEDPAYALDADAGAR